METVQDFVDKINRLLLFAAIVCGPQSQPRIEINWTGPRAKQQVVFFWHMDYNSYDESCAKLQHDGRRLRECLIPDFRAINISCNVHSGQARACIQHENKS